MRAVVEATMQLTAHIWATFFVTCLGGAAAFTANFVCLLMIKKINARVPEHERISQWYWGSEVRGRFKQLFPGDRLSILLGSCIIAMVVAFVFIVRFWVFG